MLSIGSSIMDGVAATFLSSPCLVGDNDAAASDDDDGRVGDDNGGGCCGFVGRSVRVRRVVLVAVVVPVVATAISSGATAVSAS